MENKPRITAIVSAWYAEEFLEDRIKNLLEQTVPVQIAIVCAYGTPENKIAHSMKDDYYLKPDNRHTIELFETSYTDMGIYQAWNVAIQGTEGPGATEFISNQNADDRIYPDAFEKVLHAFDEQKSRAIVYHDWAIAEYTGKVDDKGRAEVKAVSQTNWNEGGLKELLQGCFVGPGPVWRRSLHAELGYFDENLRSAGDYEFWLRVANSGKRLYHLKEVLGAYLRRDNSLEHREPVRSIWEAARARAKYADD